MSSNESLKKICINDLFNEEQYIIPIYQRNYAWGKKEIEQLIDDINDYITSDELEEKNYYLGSLIVYKRLDKKLEVIDGQQRLTTLFILLNTLINNTKFSNYLDKLIFESRTKSTNALKKIATDEFVGNNLNPHILDAKRIIEKKIKNLDVNNFLKFLLKRVNILRVEVPKDTDLNHYFEIMNNRGEQLEKHEILKSRMLNILKDDEELIKKFNKIWEVCSNMERYVQYGFDPKQRELIFGNNWNKFIPITFDEINYIDDNVTIKQKDDEQNQETVQPTFENIINGKYNDINNNSLKIDFKDTPERFTSVINFPNFLLHILKIQSQHDIALDDKRLLDIFSDKIFCIDDVKKFAYNLLKIRFLYDNYIIKRDYSKEQDGTWSLLQLYKNNKESKNNTAYYKNRFGDDEDKTKNEHILMLLSMFHVSAPTLIYKHWLNASLKYLSEQNQPIEADKFIEYLQVLAKVYMKDRFLNKEQRSYHEIIYCTDFPESKNKNLKWENLNCGTDVENFIFNYLDYLLWQEDTNRDFKFTFRTSVEHYYPQNPMENIKILNDDILNCFGNLCLISSSENSRLSNFTPKAKKDFYTKQNNKSIKQEKMMQENEWAEEEISNHQEKMLNFLKDNLNDPI